MDIKLLFLCFLFGVIMKLYDDLNDNNLFEYFNILKEKDYINYFFIGILYICLTIIAFKIPVFFSGLCIIGCFFMFADKKSFEQPVEFIFAILCILLLLYLLFFENLISNIFDECKKFYLFLLCYKYKYIYLITLYILNIISVYTEYSLINTEFSYKKLISRFLVFLFQIILFIFLNNIYPNNSNYSLIYGSSYLLTSCIFQVILIRKDIIEKSLKKEKKSLKKAKKEKKLLKIQQINTS
jgi:hypothetical protein